MLSKFTKFRTILLVLAVFGITTACNKDDDEPEPEVKDPNTPALRSSINYSTLTPTTPYAATFVDVNGDTTVDRRDGHIRYNMFRALNAYAGTANSAGAILDSAVLENMFANKNYPFVSPYTNLNGSTLQLRNVTSSSKTNAIATEVRGDISGYFGKMEHISNFTGAAASSGNAGKLTNGSSTYLVDEKGIEYAQVIQKSLIGALQLDYICNILLDKGLEVDNSYLVTGKNYTQLEHNWDEAYGFFTVRDIYASGTTVGPPARSGESFLGSYVWEYNKDGFPKIHPAFLKGRAAIVNGDMAEVRAQALLIRGICEKALAAAAIGYLGKWKANSALNTTAGTAASSHDIGEGAGFIYSLRFCKLNGADEAFSDTIITNLGLYSGNGFWDLTNDKVTAAENAIKNKFGL